MSTRQKYRSNFRPVGLYMENGRELAPANTITLTGAPSQIPNFYKRPNGVFYLGNNEAGILETGRFLAEKPHAKRGQVCSLWSIVCVA